MLSNEAQDNHNFFNTEKRTQSDPCVVDIVQESGHDDKRPLAVSVSEYRKILGNDSSTDEQIIFRIRYLESLCRNIAREELQNYVDQKN